MGGSLGVYTTAASFCDNRLLQDRPLIAKWTPVVVALSHTTFSFLVGLVTFGVAGQALSIGAGGSRAYKGGKGKIRLQLLGGFISWTPDGAPICCDLIGGGSPPF